MTTPSNNHPWRQEARIGLAKRQRVDDAADPTPENQDAVVTEAMDTLGDLSNQDM